MAQTRWEGSVLKSIKINSKSTKSQSGSIREKGRFQDPLKVTPKSFGGTWPMLERFWTELDPKGDSKIVFLAILLEK
jgi:hypothetical protein